MTVDRTDPYAALGLTPNATQGQIRRAYRTLLRHHHPDTRDRTDLTDQAASDTALQRVLAAYAILGSQAGRAGHGTTGPQTSTPTRVRPATTSSARNAPDQPPIQAGPVRWHDFRR